MHEHVTAIVVAHEELDPRVVGVAARFGDSDHDWPLTGGSEGLDDRLEALARMLLEVLVDVSDLAPEAVPIERHSSAERNRWSSHEPARRESGRRLPISLVSDCRLPPTHRFEASWYMETALREAAAGVSALRRMFDDEVSEMAAPLVQQAASRLSLAEDDR